MVEWFVSRAFLAHSNAALLLLKMSPLGEGHMGKFILSKAAVNTTYSLLLQGRGNLFILSAYFKHGCMTVHFYSLPCTKIK